MKKRNTAKRLLLCLLAAALLVAALCTLSSCSSKQAENADKEWVSDDTAITYLTRLLKTDAEAREYFTAAYRGYDMSAEDFDDAAEGLEEAKETDLEAARKALDKVAPSSDASKVKFEEYRDALTAEEVEEIVDKLKTEVDLKKDNGIAEVLVWIGTFLKTLTKITGGSYVLGLFIFAVLVEVLLLPFGLKQQKNSIKQAKMRPKEMAIRKKYAGRNDQVSQRKMQEELQKMYQDEGFNPMGGCLPLLIQLPIILALYQIVIDPLRYVLGKAAGLTDALTTYCTTARAAGGLGVELGGKSGKGTIELLSHLADKGVDGLKSFPYFNNASACADALSDVAESNLNFRLFGLNMGEIPTITVPSWLWLIPVLTFVFYFASMKLNRKFSYQPAATDPQVGCSNNMMDITMPLMSVYITFIVPAAIGVYWIFKCVISTLKQYLLHVFMPLPVFTEAEYKAAEKALKGQSKPEKKQPGVRTNKNGVQVRSLHHIDDDDEMLPPPGKEKDPEDEPEEPKKTAADEGKGGLSAAPLKDDRKNDEKKDN